MEKKYPVKVKRRIKHYTLYRSEGKWTCQSCVYARSERTLAYVDAYSIKQAYYLVHNDEWKSEDSKTGITKMYSNDKVKTCEKDEWNYSV